jgi:hypothetical protein
VANGLFTIPDLDFGGSAFTGEARWLAISVRCPAGSGRHTALDPRQALTAAPYALTLRPGAIISGTAYQNLKVESNAPTGGIPAALTGEMITAKDGVGVYGSHNNDAADAGGAGVWGRTWSPQGSGVEGTGINGAKGVKGTSDSGVGVYGESSGVGVKGKSTGFAGVWGESTSFAGVWGQSTSNTGVVGVALDTSGTTYGVWGSSHSPTGYGGYFVNEPILGQGGGGVGVYGKSDSDVGVKGESNGWIGVFGKNTATGSGVHIGVAGETYSADPYAIGVQGYAVNTAGGIGVRGLTFGSGTGVKGESGSGVGVYGVSSTGYAGRFDGTVQINGNAVISGTAYQNLKVMSNAPTGGIPAALTGEMLTAKDGVGVYGSHNNNAADASGAGVWGRTWSPQGSGVVGTGINGAKGVYGESDSGVGVWAQGAGVGMSSPALYANNSNASGIAILGETNSSDTTIVAWNKGAGDAFRSLNQVGNVAFRVLNTGQVVAPVVQITGGADLAEKFAVENHAGIEPGTLLVIDENNPGKLKISDSPYDPKVAGIVSGAGDIQPGLTLQQEGLMDGDVSVAIAGRVYVKAEAISGPIKSGDLLTTSSLPGYAMKATDRGRAYGAIIGKAMSELTHGTGLVLVLVNLQ